MSHPIGPAALGALTVAVWAAGGALYVVHRWLNRRWPVRHATDLTRDARKDQL